MFLTAVVPTCSPVREGQTTTLSCNVNTRDCATDTLLTWAADSEDVAMCSSKGCVSPYSSISATLSSTLTISSVSRADPFNMEDEWTCLPCHGEEISVCDELEIYGAFTYCSFFNASFEVFIMIVVGSFQCLIHFLFYITDGAFFLPEKRFRPLPYFLLHGFSDLNMFSLTSLFLGLQLYPATDRNVCILFLILIRFFKYSALF